MHLLDYLKTQRITQTAFAKAIDTNLSYLSHILTKRRGASEKIAVRIEKATGGKVTRKDMRPSDWHEIWPELVDHS